MTGVCVCRLVTYGQNHIKFWALNQPDTGSKCPAAASSAALLPVNRTVVTPYCMLLQAGDVWPKPHQILDPEPTRNRQQQRSSFCCCKWVEGALSVCGCWGVWQGQNTLSVECCLLAEWSCTHRYVLFPEAFLAACSLIWMLCCRVHGEGNTRSVSSVVLLPSRVVLAGMFLYV